MTSKTLNIKFKDLQKILLQQQADAFFINSKTNRFWITGLQTTAGIVLVTKSEILLLIDNRYYEFAKKALPHLKIFKIFLYHDLQDFLSILRDYQIKTLLIESNYMTVSEFQNLSSYCQLIPYDTTNLRMIKTPEEIILMQKAADIDVSAINELKKIIKVGMSEKYVANWITNYMLSLGADKNAFDLIVAFGKNAAIPHHAPTDYQLKESEFILVDIGCVYQGYCSDITRTFWLGKPTKMMLEIYQTVLHANLQAIASLKPGVTGQTIDLAAREYINNNSSWGKNFIHNTGHGVGIEIHEAPRNTPTSKDELKANSVITIEPGIYLPDIGGVRIEDTIVVNDKPMILTAKCPK